MCGGKTLIVPGQPQYGCKVNGSTYCAPASQHMFGDAYDLAGSTYLTSKYENAACQAGFLFVYNESNHLHIDTWGRGLTGCQKRSL